MKKHTTCTHPATAGARAACRRDAARAEIVATPHVEATPDAPAMNEVDIWNRRNRIQDRLTGMYRSAFTPDRGKMIALRDELNALPMTDIKARRIDAGIWDLYTGDTIVGRLERTEDREAVSGNPKSRLITHYRKRIRFTYTGADRGYRSNVGQTTLTTCLAVMNGRTDF